jgi:hypothetical protein
MILNGGWHSAKSLKSLAEVGGGGCGGVVCKSLKSLAEVGGGGDPHTPREDLRRKRRPSWMELEG